MSNRLRGRFPNRSSNRVPSWVLTAGGVPASLDVDFVNDLAYCATSTSIGALLTCTRSSSSGYYTKADGTLTTFAANTLRYGTSGLLVEGSATNLTYPNDDFSVAWGSLGATPTNATITLPTGASGTACSIVDSGSNSQHGAYPANQAGSLATGTTHTISAYFKANNRAYAALNMQASANNYVTKVFDLSGAGALGETKTGATSGTFVSATITQLAGGWYRCTMTGSVTGGSTPCFGAANAATANSFNSTGMPTYTGGSNSAVYFVFAQSEVGTFASSYIPTTSGTAQRSSDVISLSTGSAFDNTNGASYGEANQFGRTANPGQIMNNGSAYLLYLQNNGVVTIYDTTSGAQSTGSVSLSTTFKAASNWNAGGNKRAVLNGTDGGTTAFDGTMGAAASTLYVGALSTGSQSFNGYIRRLALWNTYVSDDVMMP